VAGLVDLTSVAGWLDGAPLVTPHHVRLLSGGCNSTADDWYRWLESADGAGTPTPVADPAGILDRLAAGDTALLQRIEDLDPAVGRFGHELATELGHHVGVNAYLTPPGSRGQGVHYDTHDVFVVQIHGSKHWRVWSATHDAPLPQHCPDQNSADGTPEHLVLEPGDVLYIPRGRPHLAETARDESLHLAIAVQVTTWLDVVDLIARSLVGVPRLRASLPIGWRNDRPELESGIADTLAAVASLLRDVPPSALADALLRAGASALTEPEPRPSLAEVMARRRSAMAETT
jgi:ribosomal protein L16 Arg81 hydroxylase